MALNVDSARPPGELGLLDIDAVLGIHQDLSTCTFAAKNIAAFAAVMAWVGQSMERGKAKGACLAGRVRLYEKIGGGGTE